MSLSTKIFIGMGLGILFGFFFGEDVAFLKVVGDAFVLLMQMTVLPYIMASLIVGLGGLSFQEAIALGRKCGLVLLILWAIGLLMVLLMPLAFPNWEMASFFSTSLVEQRPEFDFLSLYIPANLFHSLSTNTIPAVVVFSFALGAALIGLKDKAGLLRALSAFAGGLGRVTNFLIRLAPILVMAARENGSVEARVLSTNENAFAPRAELLISLGIRSRMKSESSSLSRSPTNARVIHLGVRVSCFPSQAVCILCCVFLCCVCPTKS